MRRQARPAPAPAGRHGWRGLTRRRTGWWTTAQGWAAGVEPRPDLIPPKRRTKADERH